jgi:hypothetical protein
MQASRLGLRVGVLTAGVPGELERLLEPYAGELEVEVIPAPATTTLATSGSGHSRLQRVLRWAGPLPEGIALDADILHLAPVARELPELVGGAHGFIGLTPQGLVRRWRKPSCTLELGSPSVGAGGADRSAAAALALARRCDALVLGAPERGACSELIEATCASGGLVAVTDGPRPALLLGPGGSRVVVEVPQPPVVRDDLGAGDVYAAALFIALAAGEPPERAAAVANAAAALRIAGHGAGAIAHAQALEQRLGAPLPSLGRSR